MNAEQPVNAEASNRYPTVEPQPDLPAIERDVLARWERDDTFRRSVEQRQAGRQRRQRVRVLRRPAVRQRAAALRPPADRIREGRRAALPDDARPPRRAPLRLGLPRAAGRGAGREGARHLRTPRDHRVRHRPLQRRLPHERAAVHPGVARLRHPPGALGRLRQRLQDARPRLHGERHVGVQDALGQGPDLRGLPRARLLLALRDAAQQHRDADGRRLPRSPGPGAHGVADARQRRPDPDLDDDAVDAAGQPGGGGRRPTSTTP